MLGWEGKGYVFPTSRGADNTWTGELVPTSVLIRNQLVDLRASRGDSFSGAQGCPDNTPDP